MSLVARIWDALACGWRAGRERWRQGADVPATKRRTSFFGCDTFESPRSAEDADAREWYASHFRQGWPR
jgi:hypothetical protein